MRLCILYAKSQTPNPKPQIPRWDLESGSWDLGFDLHQYVSRNPSCTDRYVPLTGLRNCGGVSSVSPTEKFGRLKMLKTSPIRSKERRLLNEIFCCTRR